MEIAHHTKSVHSTGHRPDELSAKKEEPRQLVVQHGACGLQQADTSGRCSLIFLAMICVAAFLQSQAWAQFTYETLKSIGGNNMQPEASLVVGPDGALYGTTGGGGS